MQAQDCVVCRKACEPPLTHVTDTAGRPTGHVVCLECAEAITGSAEGSDSSVDQGGG